MERERFTSIFATELNAYLNDKVCSGFKEKSFLRHLKNFDRFCVESVLTTPSFSRELADEWIKRLSREASTTHYSRINAIKHFLVFLSNRGYEVFITRDIAFRKTGFQPHIYPEDEIRRYFLAVDTFSSAKSKKDQIQYPVLFRLLYCCGTRINETLGIRKKDVDLGEGIIKLLETKNNCERYIVLGDDLADLLRKFAYRCFYLLNEEDYIFTSANGCRLRGDSLYRRHQLFLKKAGIPYVGSSKGPRIQDWRHTFSVNSFKQLVDTGMDLYVALPILSTYLGHKTIFATERYIRLTMNIFPDIESKFKEKTDKVFGGANHEDN